MSPYPRVSLLVLAAAGPACTPFKGDAPGVVDASRPASDASDAARDGAWDAATGDASDAGAQCWHKAPPSRPTVTDAGGALDLVFAVSDVSDRWSDGGMAEFKDIGFDLDNTCTPEQGNSCAEPSWANADHTDGEGGVDNAWAQAWPGALPIDANTPRTMVRVRDYSGQPDDDQVEVSLYVGRGLAPRTGDSDGGSDGGEPLWDGNDRFNIMPEMLSPSATPSVDEPLYSDHQAYVSGGTLVAHFPMAVFSAEIIQAPYELLPASDSIMAGTLTHSGDLWAMQDIVVGTRVRISDLVLAMAELPDPQNRSQLICQDAAEYLSYKQSYCSYVDIAFSPGAPSSAACDALSMGSLNQAKQAQFGEILPPTPPPALNCTPGINPKIDTCGPPED